VFVLLLSGAGHELSSITLVVKVVFMQHVNNLLKRHFFNCLNHTDDYLRDFQ